MPGAKVTFQFSSVQFSRSVVSDSLQPHESQHGRPPCPSPTPGFTQTHAHRVGDAIQPSHPLSSPSPPAPNPCQHQGLFQWVNSSHEVIKVLEFQLLFFFFFLGLATPTQAFITFRNTVIRSHNNKYVPSDRKKYNTEKELRPTLPQASVLLMNTQDWSPLGWTGWISLQSKGLSRVFSNTTVQKHQFFRPLPILSCLFKK